MTTPRSARKPGAVFEVRDAEIMRSGFIAQFRNCIALDMCQSFTLREDLGTTAPAGQGLSWCARFVRGIRRACIPRSFLGDCQMKPAPFDFTRPGSVHEACDILQSSDDRLRSCWRADINSHACHAAFPGPPSSLISPEFQNLPTSWRARTNGWRLELLPVRLLLNEANWCGTNCHCFPPFYLGLDTRQRGLAVRSVARSQMPTRPQSSLSSP